jgi:hypothetical protein
MSTTETPTWASKYLDDFETRMKKLETPPHKADAAKEAEDNFIQTMREINVGPPTNQAGTEGTDEENFINEMKNINPEK